MNFLSNNLYHIYNRGNNKLEIFFQDRNYIYFLNKVKKHLLIHCDILAYCLMPNHFHFLVYTKNEIDNEKMIRSIATLLSSYTQAINNQEKRTGNLFQQKTKAKLLVNHNIERVSLSDYSFVCFHYIHQNPYVAGLVNKMENWEYSSFKEYLGYKECGLVNKELAYELINLGSPDDFYESSYDIVNKEKVNGIF